MSVHPRHAEQAADLLGLDVFYLGVALRERAHSEMLKQADAVRRFERPNFGLGRRLLAAAEACDQAWAMVQEAMAESEVPA